MNEHEKIEAALERRFVRAAVPACPNLAWSSMSTVPFRRRARSRSIAYVCATLIILAGGGVAAQASGALRSGYAQLLNWGSSKPLPPMIHRADRLTIAQAQQQMPFSIVVPVGLPPHSTFEYAHVVSRDPVPAVALYYQTRIGGLYYWIIFDETTAVNRPAVAHKVPHFKVAYFVDGKGKNGAIRIETRTLLPRVWKHGAIYMEMLPRGLPPAIVNHIVQANTL